MNTSVLLLLWPLGTLNLRAVFRDCYSHYFGINGTISPKQHISLSFVLTVPRSVTSQRSKRNPNKWRVCSSNFFLERLVSLTNLHYLLIHCLVKLIRFVCILRCVERDCTYITTPSSSSLIPSSPGKSLTPCKKEAKAQGTLVLTCGQGTRWGRMLYE
ncbi:hypothetical protein DFP73DRAFT_148128 [Morchella snyderi]|nr:hypothetical protein DFP73DRAFT_148128 [Morchella snyderi]